MPLRVELYNMSVRLLGAGGTNGAWFEAQNEAAGNPDVVNALAKPLLAWHREVGPKAGDCDWLCGLKFFSESAKLRV